MRTIFFVFISLLTTDIAQAAHRINLPTINRQDVVSLGENPFIRSVGTSAEPIRWKHLRIVEGDRLFIQDQKSGLKFFLTCGSPVRYNHVAFSVANPDVSLFQINVGQTAKYNFAENYLFQCVSKSEEIVGAEIPGVPLGEQTTIFRNGQIRGGVVRAPSSRVFTQQNSANSVGAATAGR